jgi:hypothetical protein
MGYRPCHTPEQLCEVFGHLPRSVHVFREDPTQATVFSSNDWITTRQFLPENGPEATQWSGVTSRAAAFEALDGEGRV